MTRDTAYDYVYVLIVVAQPGTGAYRQTRGMISLLNLYRLPYTLPFRMWYVLSCCMTAVLRHYDTLTARPATAQSRVAVRVPSECESRMGMRRRSRVACVGYVPFDAARRTASRPMDPLVS